MVEVKWRAEEIANTQKKAVRRMEDLKNRVEEVDYLLG